MPEMAANFHRQLPELKDLNWQSVVIHDNSAERPAWNAALATAEEILGRDRVRDLNEYVRENTELWRNGHASTTARMLVQGATLGLAAWEELSPEKLRALLSPFNMALSIIKSLR